MIAHRAPQLSTGLREQLATLVAGAVIPALRLACVVYCVAPFPGPKSPPR